MFSGYAFDEFNTSKILPMPHRLFEKRLVSAWKISINLVRDHTVIPNPFLSRCCGPSNPSTERYPRQRCTSGVQLILGFVLVVKFDGPQSTIVEWYDFGRIEFIDFLPEGTMSSTFLIYNDWQWWRWAHHPQVWIMCTKTNRQRDVNARVIWRDVNKSFPPIPSHPALHCITMKFTHDVEALINNITPALEQSRP